MRTTVVALAGLALVGCGAEGDSAGTPPQATQQDNAQRARTDALPTQTDAPSGLEATIDDTAPTTVRPTDSNDGRPAPKTVDELVAELTDEEVAELGGIACATELAVMEHAIEALYEETGDYPYMLDELYQTEFLPNPLTLWALDGVYPTPVAGSGCIDVFVGERCSVAVTDVAEARLAYLEANDQAREPTQAELVQAGLLNGPSNMVDLVDGEVVMVPGSQCDGLDFDVDWERPCQDAFDAIETAYDAYLATHGSDARPTEADLVADGLLRRASPLIDVTDDSLYPIWPTPHGPCDFVENSSNFAD